MQGPFISPVLGRIDKRVRFPKWTIGKAKMQYKRETLQGQYPKEVHQHASKDAMGKSKAGQEWNRLHNVWARSAAWKLRKELFPKDKKEEFYVTHEPVAACVAHNPREYVVDSGASFHLISRKDLTKRELQTVRPAEEPQTLATANGVVQATQEAEIYAKDLDLIVRALILEDVPPVLSLGRLVRNHQCEYIWKDTDPVIRKNDGNKIVCKVRSDVQLVVPAV